MKVQCADGAGLFLGKGYNLNNKDSQLSRFSYYCVTYFYTNVFHLLNFKVDNIVR